MDVDERLPMSLKAFISPKIAQIPGDKRDQSSGMI